MASLGDALLGALLGHSDAEKMFRPWWDSLEDFVIYGLIMLGLIVSPTTIFIGTPLFCTQCTEPGQCGGNPTQEEDAGFYPFWVKSYCTMNSLTTFTLYFPYILLLSALALAAIERLFSRIFKTNIQIEGFYSLLKTEASSNLENITSNDELENNIRTVEVRESFKEKSSFYLSYLVRTNLEFGLAIILALYMVWFGVKEIETDKNVYCNVHGVYYECSGIPHQFYLSVLLVALGLLALYLVSTFSTIAWLLCPFWGKLARMMRAYSYELRVAAAAEGKDNPTAKILMGEMYQIYYNNRDLRLLLDLLAATSGLAPCLRVMALLDKSFRDQCQPIIHSLERMPSENGVDEGEVVLVFSESPLARHIFGKMDAIQCMYTVQIVPRTDKDSVEVVLFTKEDELKFFSYFRKAGRVIKPGDLPRKKFFFHAVEKENTYTVKVSLVLNGRAIATAQKKLKAVLVPVRDIQSAQATILAASMNQTLRHESVDANIQMIEENLDLSS